MKDLKSKFLRAFYHSIYTFNIMNSYVNRTMAEKFQDKKQKLTEEMDEYLRAMKAFFPTIEPLDYSKFIEYQARNIIQFLYTEMEHYFFKCFKEIYLNNSEKIGEKKVSISNIIDFNYNGKKLLEAVVERNVEDIIHGSFRKIFKEANQTFGISYQIEKGEMDKLFQFKLVRNLFAHGDGTISQHYLDNIRNIRNIVKSECKLGEKLKITLEMINDFLLLVINVLDKFDENLLKSYPKFKA